MSKWRQAKRELPSALAHLGCVGQSADKNEETSQTFPDVAQPYGKRDLSHLLSGKLYFWLTYDIPFSEAIDFCPSKEVYGVITS